MSTPVKHGGPAFPVECSIVDGQLEPVQTGNRAGYCMGVTVRDYFAAAAMQGMLSCQDFMNETAKLCKSRDEVREQIAFWAYEQANEMLRRRGL